MPCLPWHRQGGVALKAAEEGVSHASCRPEAFADNVRKMRSGADTEADLALNLLPFLSHPSMRGHAAFTARVLERSFGEGDGSRFGLVNAVTSLARDTSDPERRWDLERLGGPSPSASRPRPPAGGAVPWRRTDPGCQTAPHGATRLKRPVAPCTATRSGA